MKEHIIVSFCISSFNRKEMVKELVCNILSSASQQFEVVVVDDHSNDGTASCLNEIDDPRLRVFEKEKQEGGSACWYDAMEKGEGDWLFQIIDRDWIDVSQIDLLIHTLQELEKMNVGFAVAGEKISKGGTDYSVCKEGAETLCEFALRFSHPTGQIIRKQDWQSVIDRKEYFYNEKYGIYPHGYIYAVLGNSKKGAYLLFDVCDKKHYNERVAKTTSTVYTSRSNKKEWFWPESRYQLLLLAAENIELVENKSCIKEIMLDRYVQFFYSVTAEWYNTCQNEILKMRYHREDLETNYISLMVNGFDYIALFREYLNEKKFYWADEDFYANLCSIDAQLVKWLVDWTNDLRKKSDKI